MFFIKELIKQRQKRREMGQSGEYIEANLSNRARRNLKHDRARRKKEGFNDSISNRLKRRMTKRSY